MPVDVCRRPASARVPDVHYGQLCPENVAAFPVPYRNPDGRHRGSRAPGGRRARWPAETPSMPSAPANPTSCEVCRDQQRTGDPVRPAARRRAADHRRPPDLAWFGPGRGSRLHLQPTTQQPRPRAPAAQPAGAAGDLLRLPFAPPCYGSAPGSAWLTADGLTDRGRRVPPTPPAAYLPGR